MLTAQQIISHLELEPLPDEGGFFRQMYQSPEQIEAACLPRRYTRPMALGTAIYALFTATDFSAMHRLDTDEIYHFYAGDPLEMLLLHPDGSGEVFLLGSDLAAGMRPQKVAPRGVWQGSRPLAGGPHGFSLIGTTMAPGFEPAGFELAHRADLLEQYPQFTRQINQLIR